MAVPLALAAAAVPALFQAGTAIHQGVQANRLRKMPRPEYERPEEIDAMLQNSRMLAGMTELPQQDILEDKIRRGTAENVGRMTDVTDSPAALLGNLSKMQTAENQQMQDIAMQAANFNVANQAQYRNQLNRAAQYGDKEWQYNTGDPYQAAMAQAAAKGNAATQNMMGALNTGSSLAMMGMNMPQNFYQQATAVSKDMGSGFGSETNMALDLLLNG